MKHHITDALQVVAAILLTGGVIASAAPLPEKQASITPEVTANSITVTPDTSEKEATATTVKRVTAKWQDNPNKCNQDTHWIAKEKPFKCIRKAKSVSPAATLKKVASVSGSCADWIAAAGITDTANARELINRESGCNPYAKNPSSGACGVAQELPCGKSGCALGNGACQVKWMNSYVLGRYGSWAAAVRFHNANNWY